MLWSVAVLDMGLADELFWSLTMPLFFRLWERHKERETRADRRAGEVAIATYNVNRDTKKRPEPWEWTDVFVEHRPEPKPQTEEEMLANMELWFAVMNRGNEAEA